ncbi:MAG: FAD-dependent oxidoreductase, partial [Acidimicrobiales bacterium]
PYVELRNWDDSDIPALALVADRVHEHGSLAGIELVHNGPHAANRSTREAPIGPDHRPVDWIEPVQARAMTKTDIVEFRGWHRAAVERSIRAGYDIVYVYAGHKMTLLQYFLSPELNTRTDEYGGSLENRVRLVREVLEDARDAADGKAAIACRLCVDELIGPSGLERPQIEEVMGLLAEYPDLWDLQVGPWEFDSSTARYEQEGYQEQYVRGLKQLTTKPVVGVGRFTSPDEMVRQVKTGILDLIGAARPSIADPFLPAKLERGDIDDIRECIGCNICTSGDNLIAPIRCTQNPTMGEEWRRGWHPERVQIATAPSSVLVVGAGPSGLEAAHVLGKRGFEVTVVEATRDLGGRVHREASLPGLSSWRRVVDYRLGQIDRLSNVEIYRESEMDAAQALEAGIAHIAVATGARWRSDGVGRSHVRPISIDERAHVLTPDDILDGERPSGHHVVIFDDDHYYLGSTIAELLRHDGYDVSLVTPEPIVAAWTANTLEQPATHRRLAELDVGFHTQQIVSSIGPKSVQLQHAVTGAERELDADAVVSITGRVPNDRLAHDLDAVAPAWADHGLVSVQLIGDAWVPATIASAVWWGRRFAEELQSEDGGYGFGREEVSIGSVRSRART